MYRAGHVSLECRQEDRVGREVRSRSQTLVAQRNEGGLRSVREIRLGCQAGLEVHQLRRADEVGPARMPGDHHRPYGPAAVILFLPDPGKVLPAEG